MEWQIADAKNRLSELVNRALTDGPQRIRRRKEAVVVLAEEEYLHLTGTRPDFKAFLMHGESFEGVDLSRDKSPGRDFAV
jgi:prevent-host-death family protein